MSFICPTCGEPWEESLHFCPPLDDATVRPGREWGESPTADELAAAGRAWNGEPETPQNAHSVDSEGVALSGGLHDVGLLARRLFIEILEAQESKGLTQYGRPLAAFNGRDPFADLLFEMVDAWQYAVQARMERDRLHEALKRWLAAKDTAPPVGRGVQGWNEFMAATAALEALAREVIRG